MQRDVPHLYSRETEEQFRQLALQNNQQFHHHQQLIGGGPRPVFGGEKSELVQQIQALENGYGEEDGGENYGNVYFEKAGAKSQEHQQNDRQRDPYWNYESHQRMPSYSRQRVYSPSPPRQLYRQGQQQPQQQQQYEQFIQYADGYSPYLRQQQQNTGVGAIDNVYDGNFSSGPPPVFTTELPSQQSLPRMHYKSMAEKRRAESERARRHHSPVEGASERGYLFGGMDFIDHLSPNHLFNPRDYEYGGQGHRSRKDETTGPPRGPNDFYGLDYNTLASPEPPTQQEDINYKGYVAQQPRKHWLYTADLNAPINNFETVVVETVNPVKLIGDTLSNQKIDVAHELTEEEKNTFATTYAPPAGFKPEHMTVYPEPKSPGPICFSLSAKKELITGENPPQTSTPGSRSQNAMVLHGEGPLSAEDDSWYTTGNKEVNINTLLSDAAIRWVFRQPSTPPWATASEQNHLAWLTHRVVDPRLRRPQIMRHEPNWSRNVSQRRSAWETQSRSADSRMPLHSRPKVLPQQPPYWAGRAHTTHNVWQSAADKGYMAAGNYNTGYSTNTPANPTQDEQRQGKQVETMGQLQSAQNFYVERSDPQPEQKHGHQHNQVESHTYIKHQYPVSQPAQENNPHYQKQVYYHEHPVEEQHRGDYDLMRTPPNRHEQQQYSQQQPLQQPPQQRYSRHQQPQQSQQQRQHVAQRGKSAGQMSHNPQQSVTQRASPHQQQQYYQHQQLPPVVDRHHQQVMQQAYEQAAPQQHINPSLSTSNLINQGQQGSNQKQSSTTTTTSYHSQQQSPANHNAGTVKTHYGSNKKGLPSGRSQSHNISISSRSSQKIGGQDVQPYPTQRQQPTGGNRQQQKPEHRQQGEVNQQSSNAYLNSSKMMRKAAPGVEAQQQPPQRNNYQRIIANKQISKQGVASRYPPSRQQTQQLSSLCDPKIEMEEKLPQGQLSHSFMTTSGQFQDRDGYDVDYSRELSTSTNPGEQVMMLKQQERRVVDEPEEPGTILSF